MPYSARIERLYPRTSATPIETVAQARALVADWRGARPAKSPASWRRDAADRIANAVQAESRGRTSAAAVEREIAQVFESAALEREAEIEAAAAKPIDAKHLREDFGAFVETLWRARK